MREPKDIYTCRYKYILNREVVLSRHALLRARKRNILPDVVEATLRNGKIARFGKNLVKFRKKHREGSVICIGEVFGECIIIRTICWGN